MSSPRINTINNMNTIIQNEEAKMKSIKKSYYFERILKVKKEKEENEIVLSFNLILYEEEILFKVKEIKDNLKTESALYKKIIL